MSGMIRHDPPGFRPWCIAHHAALGGLVAPRQRAPHRPCERGQQQAVGTVVTGPDVPWNGVSCRATLIAAPFLGARRVQRVASVVEGLIERAGLMC
jgi:hypothetical protein